MLLCYDNDGVYVDNSMSIINDIKLQWGEPIASIAYISTGQFNEMFIALVLMDFLIAH